METYDDFIKEVKTQFQSRLNTTIGKFLKEKFSNKQKFSIREKEIHAEIFNSFDGIAEKLITDPKYNLPLNTIVDVDGKFITLHQQLTNLSYAIRKDLIEEYNNQVKKHPFLLSLEEDDQDQEA